MLSKERNGSPGFPKPVELVHDRRLRLRPKRLEDAKAGQLSGRRQSSARTVLSRVEFDQNQTAVMAQQEMRSWRVLHLDPAAMRVPDDLATVLVGHLAWW